MLSVNSARWHSGRHDLPAMLPYSSRCPRLPLEWSNDNRRVVLGYYPVSEPFSAQGPPHVYGGPCAASARRRSRIFGWVGATLVLDAVIRRQSRPDLTERLAPDQQPTLVDEAEVWLRENESALEVDIGDSGCPAGRLRAVPPTTSTLAPSGPHVPHLRPHRSRRSHGVRMFSAGVDEPPGPRGVLPPASGRHRARAAHGPSDIVAVHPAEAAAQIGREDVGDMAHKPGRYPWSVGQRFGFRETCDT